jgi:hypothetical protein
MSNILTNKDKYVFIVIFYFNSKKKIVDISGSKKVRKYDLHETEGKRGC